MQNHLRHARLTYGGIAAFCAAFAFSGCTTWQNNVQSQVTTARTVIDTAKSAGAERYAPDTIQSADKHIAQAQQLIILGKFPDAARAAEQAVADGQLAAAQAQAGGRNAEVQALRQEISSLMQ